eukprot:3113114-Prymnesium_polylepis.1
MVTWLLGPSLYCLDCHVTSDDHLRGGWWGEVTLNSETDEDTHRSIQHLPQKSRRPGSRRRSRCRLLRPPLAQQQPHHADKHERQHQLPSRGEQPQPRQQPPPGRREYAPR